MSYAPLDFITKGAGDLPQEISCRTGHMWEDAYPVILQNFFGMSEEEAKEVLEHEFLKYMLRRKFLIKGQNREKRHARWDESLMKVVPMILSTLGYTPVTLSGHGRITSEIRDTLAEFLILDKWVRNKQVLKPDPVFAKYLCETEKLQITENTFENLPFNTFYLDLEDCNKEKIYGDALGIFVNIMSIPEDMETALTLYVLRPGNIVVSLYLNFDMRECPHEIHASGIEESKEIKTLPVVIKNEKAPETTMVNPRLMTILVLQLINYMKVAKPDIAPSPEMRTTYRPKSTIKNKYSEIYKQDVGIRLGASISGKIKEMKRAEKEQKKEAVVSGRKPPVPHFRKAHWQRFWTGKGRTTCEVRWIEPVFVCGSYSSDSATDVIIHNVHK